MIGSVVKNFNIARSGVYVLESLPLAMTSRLMGKVPPPTNEQLKTLWPRVLKLHEQEAMNIDQGLYGITRSRSKIHSVMLVSFSK